uniref:Uncharacterized protein n=1 Tax=Rhizophora mucronata TaxID=61149 RepID=A0A2P2PBS5_RHIMU
MRFIIRSSLGILTYIVIPLLFPSPHSPSNLLN